MFSRYFQSTSSSNSKKGKRANRRQLSAARRRKHLQFEPLEDRRLLATFTVNNFGDIADPAAASPNDGVMTLREAIYRAELNPNADVIQFGSPTSDKTVSLSHIGSAGNGLGPSAFDISTDITIVGPAGSHGVSINRTGAESFRLFHVSPSGSLAIRNLTLTPW